MTGYRSLGFGRVWSLAWVVLVRLLLNLVIAAFFLQRMYFGSGARFERPWECIILLAGDSAVYLGLLFFCSGVRRLNLLLILAYVLDMVVLTRIILFSGGFHSVLIPYYLPAQVFAPAWFPRRFTAVFPSLATLGVAYIGLAHFLAAMRNFDMLLALYPGGLLPALGNVSAPGIVTDMLVLTVLFFVIAYLSAFLSDKLFLAQRLNQEMLSSMKEGVAVADAGGKLLFANDEFSRIFRRGDEKGDFSGVLKIIFPGEGGKAPIGLLTADDAPESLAIVREPDETLGLPPMEIRVSTFSLREDGDQFWLVFWASDLSMRRRMERSERELAHFASITAMAAGLAHEIRNPLASLRSAVQEIGDAFPMGSQNRALTNIVISESDRLDRVIGRFLDFSREGELRTFRRRLAPLLEDTRTLILRDKPPGVLDMTIDVRKNPEIQCDPDRLREVFLNLALNAAQIVPSRGGKLEITLDEKANEGLPGVEILFMDNGPGMAEEVGKRLFTPFFTTKKNGTGMGLPLSRKQVSLHGGEITAENREGGGACFRVWLPLSATISGRSGDTKFFRQGQTIRKT